MDAQFSRLEGVFLSHGLLRAIQTIKNEVAKIGISHLAVYSEMFLFFLINKIHMVAFGIPAEKVNQQRLYRALDKLLPHKEALEKHLKDRLGSLFDLKYDLLLYDVTSTYFEGQCEANPMAQRGYSRDNRSV